MPCGRIVSTFSYDKNVQSNYLSKFLQEENFELIRGGVLSVFYPQKGACESRTFRGLLKYLLFFPFLGIVLEWPFSVPMTKVLKCFIPRKGAARGDSAWGPIVFTYVLIVWSGCQGAY